MEYEHVAQSLATSGSPAMTDQKPTSDEGISMDTDLGRLVVGQNLATRAEVDACLSIQAQEKEAKDAGHRSLASILVEEGMVTSRQIERIKKTIEDSRTQQIPGYKILSKLGMGAMAVVFKARQISLDREVAIKVLPKKLCENPEYVKLFYKEGRAAAKLNHPNIVQAYDVGEAGGYHFFVMEYVKGHSLFDELEQGKVFSEGEAMKVIVQIARALEHAHSRGLIHRDVKPKNIMMTDDGVAKLADMGLARAASDADAARAEAGRAYGTPYYISPEQIRGEMDIDFRSDIYSLGATLYHLVTGRVPFEGATPAAVMHRHLKDSLVPPDHINTGLSSGLGEVVEVMMAKDRRHRYASTGDLLVDLEQIARGQAPPLARKQIDAGVLSGLEQEASAGDTAIVPAPGAGPAGPTKVTVILIVLAATLAISLFLNVLLLSR
jgi:eukaryotic-like serine/threonine-protein kinase